MTEPRLMSGAEAAAYCGLCPTTFSGWVAAGRLPNSLPGTRRWDRKAVDLALDEASGLAAPTINPSKDAHEIGTTRTPLSAGVSQTVAKGSQMPGLASASKTLADGSRRKYFYAWRGGPLLKTESGTPLQLNDPAFVVAYLAAHAERKKPAAGTLFSLIAAYKASSEFTKCAPRSKKDYLRFLKKIEDEFGTLPLAILEKPQARGRFKVWRDCIAESGGARQADYAWGMLARRNLRAPRLIGPLRRWANQTLRR